MIVSLPAWKWIASVLIISCICAWGTATAQDVATGNSVTELASELEQLSAELITQAGNHALANDLPDYVRRLREQANQASTTAWSAIKSLEDWQRFRDEKLTRLRQSLGQPTSPPVPLVVEVTGRHADGAGRFVIENIVYQSRPNVWVTANLYRPATAVTAAPGIIISHAHHTSKEHAELQAMGMTWARAGCYVLVPDHFGHGERRQHPLVSAESFPGSFRVSRQDYYFRYDSGLKLHLIGESLMSWLAWDLSRGVDCLLAQPGIDAKKIILLGAVAGGGDPCAVAATLDDRIAAAVPFNFGGQQPETTYPLPDDAETKFNYAGSGSWESTRNLTGSAADGFLPWVIVGGIAPRRLIYAHEFRWDQPHDPVWKRLQSIYGLYGHADHLDFTHGRGELRGQPPEATHCTHIGAFHRQRIHAAFRSWFDIDVSPADEIFEPLSTESLQCLSKDTNRATRPTLVDFESLARERIAATRLTLARLPNGQRRPQLQALWSQGLGERGPTGDKHTPTIVHRPALSSSNVIVDSVCLSTPEGLSIPLALLRSSKVNAAAKRPVVLVVQTSGKATYLKAKASELASLIAAGHAVCIPDLRGTGETSSGAGRGRSSAATSMSSSLLMSGDPLVAGQFRDLLSVWSWLRARADIDGQRMQVWADSRRPTVTADIDRVVPRDDDSQLPPSAEPTAGLMALLLSLYEDDVHSLCITGGLNSFATALGPQQVRVPHDCILPGLFQACDLEELIVQAAERLPVRCESLVNGRNMLLSQLALDEYSMSMKSYCPDASQLKLTMTIDSQAGEWMLRSR